MSEKRRGFIIIPFINNWKMTWDALCDASNQDGVKSQVLLIDNGSDEEGRVSSHYQTMINPGTLLWQHNPPLPSLAATWNAALDFVWDGGGEEALVINNDVRIHPKTYGALSDAMRMHDGLFVSAVAVGQDQWPTDPMGWSDSKGGPDFSCFLISRVCHSKYRFDEAFTPAYCEDVDFHRRMMLGGDGERIFGINVPYRHFGSGTIQSMTAEKQEKLAKAIGAGSRRHYEEKWGGPVNDEKYLHPYGYMDLPKSQLYCPSGCVTTPQLQGHRCGGRAR